MLGVLPIWKSKTMSTSSGISDSDDSSCRDQYEPIKKLAMVQLHPPRNPNKPFTSFGIKDILGSNGHRTGAVTTSGHRISNHHSHPNHRHSNNHSHHHHPRHISNHNNTNRRHIRIATVTRIVRPWDSSPSPGGRCSENSSDADDEEINVDDDEEDDDDAVSTNSKDVSPLDALMEMANKTFQGLETSEAADAKRREQAALFGKHSAPKKRRKSRTAFTNQQIYELEKRFLYQKYLTPADRDEIAQNLGLTNAQVITWFQNRRAKLKRDLEELKNDVVATKHGSPVPLDLSEAEFQGDSDSMDVSPPKQCKTPSRSPDPPSPTGSFRTSHAGSDVASSPSPVSVHEEPAREET